MASDAQADVLRYIRGLAAAGRRQEQSDAQLLRQFVAGRDEAAFAVLLQRHGPLVFGICRQVLSDRQDAEDTFQATFLVLARKAASIRRQESLGAWLHRVALNLCRTAAVETARRRAYEREAALMAQPTRPADIAPTDWQRIVHEEVDRLPEKYRLPVVLCYLQGKTHPEAAGELGWPLGTVKGRLARARDLLRTRLARRGVTLSAGGIAAALAPSAAQGHVPTALLSCTFRAAVCFADGKASEVSAHAVTLAKEALQTMTTSRLVRMLVLLFAIGVAGFGVALGLGPGREARSGPGAAELARADSPPAPSPEAGARLKGTDAHGDPLPPGVKARLGTIRFRYLSRFAFSPDGKTLAALDGLTLRLLEVATGKECREFQGQPGGYAGAPAFSPRGERLAAVDGRGTLYLWETATGKEVRRITVPPRSYVLERAFSPDGKTLALLSYDGWITLLDLPAGNPARKFVGHKLNVMASAFSPDGLTLASASLDGTVRLWDVTTGKELRRLPEHKGGVESVSFSPDGKILLSGGRSGGTMHWWDVATGKEMRRTQADRTPWGLNRVAFSPDGQVVASVGKEKIVRLWDAGTGRELRSFNGAHEVAFSPDGKILAAHGPYGTTVRLWDAATGKSLNPSEGHTSPVEVITVSPDGALVASGGKSGTIRLWQVAAGKFLRQLSGHTDPVFALAFSPDGKTLASLSHDRTIRTWAVATGRELRRIVSQEADAFTSLAFAPHGKALASGALDGTVRYWDVATGKKLHHFQAHPYRVNKYDDLSYAAAVSVLAFSPDGKVLATGIEKDETFHLFDAQTGTRRRQLQAPLSDKDNCFHKKVSLAFSPDGKTLATGSGHKMVRFWEVATGKERRRLSGTNVAGKGRFGYEGSERWPYTLAYSPDGKRLASWGHQNDTIRVWDAATGKELAHLRGHRGDVTAVAFLPGGEGLISASGDTTLLVWDARLWEGK
jgi:RNA polymerase sigma factor (sigma-70 family)